MLRGRLAEGICRLRAGRSRSWCPWRSTPSGAAPALAAHAGAS